MHILIEILFNSTTLRVIKGDLTEAHADAIVNAANSRLQHGGGVAGALLRKGGAVIQEESNRIEYVPVGECALTSAGKLNARGIIHTVGPQWGEGDEETKLRNAVRNTLKLADANHFSTIAMPAISAGIFGFPKDRCARIITKEIKAYSSGDTAITGIDIYLIDPEMIEFFTAETNRIIKDQ